MTILITGASGAIGLPTHPPSGQARREAARAELEGKLGDKPEVARRRRDCGRRSRERRRRDARDAGRGVGDAHSAALSRGRSRRSACASLRAAVEAEVDHFVFSSVFHPQMRDMDHHFNKLVVEEALIDSGLPFTILQPAMFMQNIRLEWPGIRRSRRLSAALLAGPAHGHDRHRGLRRGGGARADRAGLSRRHLRAGRAGSAHHRRDGGGRSPQEWGKPVRAEKRSIDRLEVMGQGEQLESLGDRGLCENVPSLRRARLCRRQSAGAVARSSAARRGGYRAFIKRFLSHAVRGIRRSPKGEGG